MELRLPNNASNNACRQRGREGKKRRYFGDLDRTSGFSLHSGHVVSAFD